MIKSITAREVFKELPDIRKVLWGREPGTNGYYFAMVRRKGDKKESRSISRSRKGLAI